MVCFFPHAAVKVCTLFLNNCPLKLENSTDTVMLLLFFFPFFFYNIFYYCSCCICPWTVPSNTSTYITDICAELGLARPQQ